MKKCINIAPFHAMFSSKATSRPIKWDRSISCGEFLKFLAEVISTLGKTISYRSLFLILPRTRYHSRLRIAYTIKTANPQIQSKSTFSKLQMRKKLHKIPNAFCNRGEVRVMYNGMPLVIIPNTVVYNLLKLIIEWIKLKVNEKRIYLKNNLFSSDCTKFTIFKAVRKVMLLYLAWKFLKWWSCVAENHSRFMW